MGLLRRADWKAKWIRWQNPEEDADRKDIRWIWVKGQDALAVVPNTTATFRATVNLSGEPRYAVLLLAARGNFVAKVNGHEVGAKKGWGTFDRRDISDQLVKGKNFIEVTLTAPESPRSGPNAGAQTVKAALAALVKITRPDGSTMIRDARLPVSRGTGRRIWNTRRVGNQPTLLRTRQTSSSGTRDRCRNRPRISGERSHYQRMYKAPDST